MLRRLYFQIYLGVVASLAALVLLAGLFWHFEGDKSPPNQVFETVRDVILLALPPPDAEPAKQQEVLERLARPSLPRISLFSADGKLLAHVGPALISPAPDSKDNGWISRPDHHSAWAMHLADGRWLLAQPSHEHPGAPLPLIISLALIGLVVALIAYPMARRITRRLEDLKQAVEELGAGNFTTRIPVVGSDEVSSLAISFNLAAEHIDSLLQSHKKLLANASHELRSPLTRIRLAVEMQNEQPTPELAIEIQRNIGELDQLIEEILLASRLDARREPVSSEAFNLTSLVAEECEHAEVQYDLVPLTLHGDARLMRRLLRNLLENARRHGGEVVHVNMSKTEMEIVIQVCDNGDGIPEHERELIFEPFYRPAGSREKEGSYGLGLSLVRQIAEYHKGNVRCLANPQGGTCFEVRLPASIRTY
jgi:signal transduction histidine kinase